MNAPNPMIAPAAAGGVPAAGFPTGQGQEYTHATHRQTGEPNTASHAGQPYPAITGREIAAMVEDPPPRVDKARGRWFIPSTYAAHDARSHEAQRARGSFNWLTLDVDENDLPLADVLDALRGTLGACRFLAYSTPSATAQRRKWRVLVPIAAPLAGADFTDTQEAFFSLLIEHSQGALIPDPALKRPAQLIYLPNPQGDFYEREICRDAPVLALTDSHAVMLRREENRAKRAEAEREANSRRERRAAERAALAFGDGDRPGDIFNARHSVADLLARYGYAQCRGSSDWRSPMQTSKSFATRDMGEYWISLSASDAAAGIGSQTKSGCRFGDAFDLFVHFEHGGDMSKAAKAYWAELQSLGGWSTLSSDFPAPMPRTVPPDDLRTDFAPQEPAPHSPAGSSPHSATAKPARLFPLTRFCDLPSAAPEWIVEGMIEAGALAMLFGPPGCGKSFVALDLASSVASGCAWHGRAVKAGPVVYLAGEGLSGLRRRQDAWRARHDVRDDLPLFVGRRAPMLLDVTDVQAVAAAVANVAVADGPPRLIVIDTVARAFAGGDENATADMGRFVAAADALKASYPECAVLLVHHSGHGDANRGRGSSALKAALDAEFGVSKAGEVVSLRCSKMKDAEPPSDMAFALETVELGEDATGQPVTSAILVPKEAGTVPRPAMTPAMRRAMDAFHTAKLRAGHADDLSAGVPIEDWRKVAYEQSTADTQEARQKGFARARTALVDAGFLSVADDFYRLARVPK